MLKITTGFLYKIHRIIIYLVFVCLFVWLLGCNYGAHSEIQVLVAAPIVAATLCSFLSISATKWKADLLTAIAILSVIIAAGFLIMFHDFLWAGSMSLLSVVSYIMTYLGVFSSR